MVRPQCFQCGSTGSILGWRKDIPKATVWPNERKTVMCVPHIFLESTVADGSAERLSILPNVKGSKDLRSRILLTTGASCFLNWGS